MQSAALHMKDNGGGAIVNIGSGCNRLPFPNLVAYTASKGGIEMLTKVAAVKLVLMVFVSTALPQGQLKSNALGKKIPITQRFGVR